MKKVVVTLLVAVLAVFSFAAFEVTGGYVHASVAASDTAVASDVSFNGLSIGANYLYEDLGFVEGGALVLGGAFDYYFPVKATVEATSVEFTQMDITLNLGYRQSLNPFLPELPVDVFVEGLFNYSFGLGDNKLTGSSLAFGGGAGAAFVVQNLDVKVGADILFAKPTIVEEYKEDYKNSFKPKFKVFAGVEF
ncbi:MAG TPA: outer membrane beta-barrel protein [Defluviitoga tunisiensis]|nr:outer membrane beta-barrel protein [Defluviitoga tunisiensis]